MLARSLACCFNPNPLRERGMVCPSLTLRVVMKPLPAENPLKQHALTLRVVMFPLPFGKTIKATSR
jgi:hypothetical protein